MIRASWDLGVAEYAPGPSVPPEPLVSACFGRAAPPRHSHSQDPDSTGVPSPVLGSRTSRRHAHGHRRSQGTADGLDLSCAQESVQKDSVQEESVKQGSVQSRVSDLDIGCLQAALSGVTAAGVPLGASIRNNGLLHMPVVKQTNKK